MTESDSGIFNAILRGHMDFSTDPWPSISSSAKDLIKKMLNSDPKARITAQQVLGKLFFYNLHTQTPIDSFELKSQFEFLTIKNLSHSMKQ